MTKKCVDLLLEKFGHEDIVIAIVDNASDNGSGTRLETKYSNCETVKVILNKENLGFARGNNVGYRYIKELYTPEYIIVMNNDVLIHQKEFLEEIEKIYKRTNFGILGPDVFCSFTSKQQNPARLRGFTIEEIEREQDFLERRQERFAYYYYRRLIWGKIKHLLRGIVGNNNENIKRDIEQQNVVLHGCCYIFSKNFICKRENAFLPDTFLYFEEDILHYECMKDNILMLYSPVVKVEHLDDISTNAVFKSKYKKEKMKNSEMLKSINIFLKLISSDG
jgi:GT2 family glycosyltransferase